MMLKRIALCLIRLYQEGISAHTPVMCRYVPSCSHYGYEAIERYGILKGGWLTAKRLSHCHPFSRGGVDPVP